MDIGQMKFVTHDTNITPNTGGTFGSSSIASAGPRVRSAAATAKQALLGARGDAARRRRSASLSVEQGRRLRRRQVRHLRRADRRQAVQRRAWPRRASTPASGARRRPVERSTSSSTKRTCRGSTSRTRSPASTSTCRTSACRGCSTAALVRPRGQGAYGDGTMPKIVSVDESSIKHIPGVADRPAQRLLGVVGEQEYAVDPGGGAAQGEVRRPAEDREQRQPLEADARLRRRRPGPGADRGQHGQLRQRVRVGAVKVSRHVQAPVQRPHADRPDCGDRARDQGRRARLREHAGRVHDARRASPACSACRVNKVRDPVLGGLGLVRQRSGPTRRRPGGRGHVAARGRAGAAPVHALGRARLGQLRPARSWRTSAAAPTRTARSSRTSSPASGWPRSASTRRPSSVGTAGRRAAAPARSTRTTRARSTTSRTAA